MMRIEDKLFCCVLTDTHEGTRRMSTMTAEQIINHIDMADCYDEKINVYDINRAGNLVKCQVHGCWHNPKDPLYIKVTYRKTDAIIFDGYGTDH